MKAVRIHAYGDASVLRYEDAPQPTVDAGKLRPIVGAEFALEDIRRAHAFSKSRHAMGKIDLYVGRP